MFDKPEVHIQNYDDTSYYVKSDLKEYSCEHSFIEFYVITHESSFINLNIE